MGKVNKYNLIFDIKIKRSIADNISNAPYFLKPAFNYAGIASWPIILRILISAYRILPKAVLMLTRVT